MDQPTAGMAAQELLLLFQAPQLLTPVVAEVDVKQPLPLVLVVLVVQVAAGQEQRDLLILPL
jgi:hypothetical protein